MGVTSPSVAVAQCAECDSGDRCGPVDWAGAYSCSYTSGGECDEVGVCVIGEKLAAAELSLSESDFRDFQTEFGKIALAPVGQSRFAGWSCNGDLIVLTEKLADGSLAALPLDLFRNQYRYSAVVGLAERSTIE